MSATTILRQFLSDYLAPKFLIDNILYNVKYMNDLNMIAICIHCFFRELYSGQSGKKTSKGAEKLEFTFLQFSYFAKLFSGPDWTQWLALDLLNRFTLFFCKLTDT